MGLTNGWKAPEDIGETQEKLNWMLVNGQVDRLTVMRHRKDLSWSVAFRKGNGKTFFVSQEQIGIDVTNKKWAHNVTYLYVLAEQCFDDGFSVSGLSEFAQKTIKAFMDKAGGVVGWKEQQRIMDEVLFNV